MKKIIKNLMRQNNMLLLLFMLMANFVHAAKVSEQQANLVAVNFLKSTTGLTSFKAMLNYKQVEKDGSVDFYVFNFLSYNGFVIVTGDDNLEPIIAYSTESGFDISIAQHIGVNDWMNDARNQIQDAFKSNVKADTRISNLWSAYLSGGQIMSPQSAAVAPLLTTLWNQSKTINGVQYYNSLCPFDATANQYTPAGCVATAMAQILKYWNQPTKGIGSHSYTSGSYGTQSANFGTTTYNWSQMPDVPIAGSTHDIDKLMYHCGVAVNMDYGVGGSGATTIGGSPSAQAAYVTYFGYRNTIQGLYASNYSSSAWTALLKNELDAKRPMQYRGVDPAAGGHSWVCDGYDANSMFHMNWGWGGSSNGYFSVANLNPGGYTFNTGTGAIIGIWPGNLSDCDSHWTLSGNQTADYTWQASDYITSTKTIPANIHVAFTAANKITLSPGFHASTNSNFSAKIQPCSTYRIGGDSSPETIGEAEEENLSVYPNPTNGMATLKFSSDKNQNCELIIIDLTGRIVKQQLVNAQEGVNDHSLDLTHLAKGVYLVKIKIAEGEAVKRIVKN